ncbi:MAG: hypothetical protein AAFN43_09875 [Pseudomonadota bacterium]
MSDPAFFEAAKSAAQMERLWKRCLHRECKRRKRCTGGPRGTARKTGGVPFCRLQGNLVAPTSKPESTDPLPWHEEPDKHRWG